MSKVLQLKYETSLTDITERNSSFDSGTLRICYVGKNRNNSYISKKTLEEAIPSLYNCPVVCNYNVETDSIGGHDVDILTDDNGNLRMINATQPVGLVPESAKVWFEEFTEDDGKVHEYLCSEVLLWKRQAAYSKIKRDEVTAHSMEISVDAGEQKNGVFCIDNLEFTALCLLGDCEPCFEGSALEFARDDFSKQMSEMYKEFKASFANHSMEGGNDKLDNIEVKTETVETVETAVEATEQNEESVVETEVEAAAESEPELPEGEQEVNDGEGEDEETEAETPEEESKEEDTFALNSNLVGEIIRALEQVTVEKSWGVEPRYWYIDCDIEKSEAYCIDTEDWLLYGFTYTVSGDAVTIDFDTKARKQYTIVDFVDDTEEAPSVFSYIEKKLDDAAEVQTKYSQVVNELNTAKEELDTLRAFKKDIEDTKANEARDAVLSKFADKLSAYEEFIDLKSNASEYDAQSLEEKCFAICGRHGVVFKFSSETPASTKTRVDKTTITNEAKDLEDLPYGGLVERYRKRGTAN